MNSQKITNLPGVKSYSTAKENTRLLRSTKGRLLRLKAINLNTTTLLYVQLHDTITPLAGGEVPMFPVPIGANGFANLEDFDFGTGVTVALSTTPDTYTAPGANYGWFYGETI